MKILAFAGSFAQRVIHSRIAQEVVPANCSNAFIYISNFREIFTPDIIPTV